MEVKKHLNITGTSGISWKDATVKAIAETAKTIDFLSGVKIIDQRADIEDGKISKYYVDLDLTFVVDTERKNNNDE